MQDGSTPLNHLTPGPGGEKLRQILNQYLEEQRKRRALEKCSQTKAKMDELECELSNIVGLSDLKLQLRKWARGMLLDERRRALGLKVGARRPPHMAFLGNPGTGNCLGCQPLTVEFFYYSFERIFHVVIILLVTIQNLPKPRNNSIATVIFMLQPF